MGTAGPDTFPRAWAGEGGGGVGEWLEGGVGSGEEDLSVLWGGADGKEMASLRPA